MLSLCMIVRDSTHTLPACLESIRPWVDEIIVVDTGSLDDTREIARSFDARVFEFPWIDDFSAARNESLKHAQGEWLFWMDSDDTIDAANGEQLRSLAYGDHAQDMLGYVIQVHCPSPPDYDGGGLTVVDHVKLFRNRTEIRFECRIHEQVLPSIRRLGGQVAWTDLFVVHSGSDQTPEGKQRKIERDLRILKLDLAERPDHPFVLFNLGMTYEDIGQYDEAEKWLRRCLAASRPGESHVRKAYALLANCLSRLNRFREAKAICEQALAKFPLDDELRFRLGVAAHNLGESWKAEAAYRSILGNRGARHFTSVDSGIAGFKTRHNLALVYAELGKRSLSELQWWISLAEAPSFRAGIRALAQSLLDQGKLATAELLADELQALKNTATDGLWLKSEIARRRDDVEESRKCLERAWQLEPDSLLLLRARCRLSFEQGSLSEAATALERLTEKEPNDPSAHYNLGQVYAQQSDNAKAIAAFERSLALRPNWEPTVTQLASVRKASRDC
jgi:tetratricopeptide (TPR) repeat protein